MIVKFVAALLLIGTISPSCDAFTQTITPNVISSSRQRNGGATNNASLKTTSKRTTNSALNLPSPSVYQDKMRLQAFPNLVQDLDLAHHFSINLACVTVGYSMLGTLLFTSFFASPSDNLIDRCSLGAEPATFEECPIILETETTITSSVANSYISDGVTTFVEVSESSSETLLEEEQKA